MQHLIRIEVKVPDYDHWRHQSQKMNFRFAHYDPPKEEKRRPRRPANASRKSSSKISTRAAGQQTSISPSKESKQPVKPPQQALKAKEGPHNKSLTPVSIPGAKNQNIPLTKSRAVDRSVYRGIDLDYSSPSTVTTGSTSSSDHGNSTVATSTATTPLTCYDQPTLPSLLTVLDEGRIDPFRLYPVDYITPYVQTLIDHGMLVSRKASPCVEID
jgi:hypothetical protein